jgi:hypothetical protein
MPDDTIRDVVQIDGDASGGVKALNTTADKMGQTEKAASSLSTKLSSWGQSVIGFLGKTASGVGGFVEKLKGGTTTATSGINDVSSATEKAGKGQNQALALALPGWLKLSALILGAKAAIGGFLSAAANLAGQSRDAEQFNARWSQLTKTLSAPIVQTFTGAFRELNKVLADPAVRKAAQGLASLASLLGGAFLDVLHQAAMGFEVVVRVFQGEDLDSAIKHTAEAIKGGFQDLDLGPTGKVLIDKLLKGFTQGDFSVLDATRAAIQQRLQTLVDLGQLPKDALITRLIGGQSAVADALASIHQAGGVTDAIVNQVRGALKDLGPEVQDFVVAQLQAAQATEKVAAAQKEVEAAQARVTQLSDQLRDKQLALASVQKDQEQIQDKQRERAEALIPLQDQLRSNNEKLNQLLQDQEPRRENLYKLSQQQADAEAQLTKLQEDQAAKLRELEPLRVALREATEKQRDAELALQQAQDASLPLQQAVKEKQAQVNQLVKEAAAHEKSFSEQIDAASKALDQQTRTAEDRARTAEDTLRTEAEGVDKLQRDIQTREQTSADTLQAAQEDLQNRTQALQDQLDSVTAKYEGQIAVQQKLADAVDAKWKKDIDGAQKAYDIAKSAYDLEQKKNDIGNLKFEQQKAAAQSIGDPNQRTAALARLQRAQDQYNSRNEDALKVAQLQAQVTKENLDTTTSQRDAEKQGFVDAIASFQKLEATEKAAIQARLDSVQKEGQKRIQDLQRAAEQERRNDANQLQAAQDRLKTDTEAEDVRKRADDDAIRASRDSLRNLQEAADTSKKTDESNVAAAQSQLDSAQAALDAQNSLVDAASRQVELAGRATEEAQHQLSTSEQQVHDETDGAITAAQIRAQSLQDQGKELQRQLDSEQHDLRTRIDDEKAELDLRQSKIDAINEKENRGIQKRLEAAQDEVTAASSRLDSAQHDLDLANRRLTANQKTTDEYQKQADLANARIQNEQKNAAIKPEPAPPQAVADFGSDAAFPEKAPTGLEALRQQLRKNLQPLANNFREQWESVFGKNGWLATTMQDAADRIGEIAGGIGDLFSDSNPESIGAALSRQVTDIQVLFAPNGTLAHTIQGWSDQIVGIANGMASGLGSAAQNAWNTVTGWFKKLWDDLVGHSIVPDTVNGVTSWFGKLPGELLGIGGQILTNVTGKFDSLKTNALARAKDIWTGVTGFFQQTRDDAVTKAQGLWTDVSSKFSGLKDEVTGPNGIVAKLVSGVTGKFGDLVDGLTKPPKGVIPAAISAVTTAVGGFLENGKQIIGKLFDGAKQDASKLWDGLTKSPDGIIPQAVSSVGGALGGFLTNGKNLVGQIVSGIQQNGSQIWNSFTGKDGLIGQAISSIGTALSGFIATGTSIIGQIVSGVKKAATDLYTSFTDPKEGILATLLDQTTKGLPDFGKLGEGIIAGILKGLADHSRALLDFLHNLGIVSDEAYKEATQQKSPSKLFAKSGKNNILGLIVGMEGERGNLLNKIRDIARAGVGAMNNYTASGGLARLMTAPAIPTGNDLARTSALLGQRSPATQPAPVHINVGTVHAYNQDEWDDFYKESYFGQLIK